MEGEKPYHHKDLRAALLEAAEAELIEKGLERFSLRGVARRAGVSHAAPAHYFDDVDSLITALGAIAFSRLHLAMATAVKGQDPKDDLVAIGLAYIRYAEAHPDLFTLQFSSERPKRDDPEFNRHARASFAVLRDSVAAFAKATGRTTEEEKDIASTLWATTHGLATLFAINRRREFAEMSAEERHRTFERILRRLADAH
ncbi:MAG: TetR-like C-terminal domain-containing protein [Rhodospirillales bacterium]